MVLWELTLGTAYFLGLKRTYRLALRIQRRIVSPKYPKLRHFLHGRTRGVFNVALRVHRSIQERDIEVGRNLGNFILRWLDRMKPSARIRGPAPPNSGSRERVGKDGAGGGTSSDHKGSGRFGRDSDRHLFTSSSWTRPFPTIGRMMRPSNPPGTTVHRRHFTPSMPQIVGSNYGFNWSGGVIRKDIMLWMQN